MRITFDPGARADLDEIFAWISKDNETAAYAMISRIEGEDRIACDAGVRAHGKTGP